MKNRISFMTVLALLALSLIPALGVSAQEGIESICLITDIGRVNDGTFNQYAYEGMVRAEEDFDLDTVFIETQSQTDFPANIETCLQEGYDAIITIGFLIADATTEAAAANPDVYFIGVDQVNPDPENLPNYVGLQFREDQAGFLAGAMAALMSKSNVIAGVYGIDVPAVVKFRHGYESGARYINPDIEVLGVYIDSFVAADRGATAAEQFIGEGADVVFGAGGTTGSGGTRFAAVNGAYVIGVDQDEYYTTFGSGSTEGAENLITSAVKRVDNAVYDMIEALVNGDALPETGVYMMEAANDGIGFAEAHDADVPEDVIEQIQEIYEGLKDGSIETGIDPITGSYLDESAEATPEATASS